MRDWMFLTSLARFGDASLFALRLLTGSFLVWEMWFNISSAETMTLVVTYFRDNGFAYPEFFAPLSAWAQFLIGIALIFGLATRWAGLLLAFNFIVGMVMVHLGDTLREQWPALALLFTGLLFAAYGGGRYALDRRLSPPLVAPLRLAMFKNAALLALRWVTGIFLIHGVWDNIIATERMTEFTAFLAAHHFPLPALMAPLSVYAQFAIGVALLLGVITRWAGLVLIVNFVVALAMVHWSQSGWPAIMLVGFGFLFAAKGGGRYALDHLLMGRMDDRDSAETA